MSYLDVPRLHFAGTFTADPSTINNTIANYDPANRSRLNLSWNPYGSHVWTVDATVTSFVDASGQLHTGGDPVIGAPIGSYAPRVPAKLVDLDTDQQTTTRLFGFNVQLGTASAALLRGLWQDEGTLIALWFSRVQSGGDSGASGAFQSILKHIAWGDLSTSPLLQQLQKAAGQGLSVRLATYGYQDDNASPGFHTGSIVGTIGPAWDCEPLHFVAGRFLNPVPNSPMWYAPAVVNEKRSTLTIDLGNSIPDQASGGPPVALGTMQAAILTPGQPVILGTIDYSQATYQQLAGVYQLPLTAEQLEQAGCNPLGVLIPATGSQPPSYIQGTTGEYTGLQEAADGQYAEIDGSTLYLNPGDSGTVDIWATTFGKPASRTLTLDLVPNLAGPGNTPVNNLPANAVNFPASVTTDGNGFARFVVSGSDPVPKEPRREFVDGQLYFIGGPWSSGADQVCVAPLTVKVFNSVDPEKVQNPVWADVQPVLFQFYWLYGYMASIVDLSTYDSVVENAASIKQVILAPFTDPMHMPVTREMSQDQQTMIVNWIDAGCPH